MKPFSRGLALSAATVLVLASCGGDSESRPPVIQVSAGANSGGPTGGNAASESMAGVSADSKMMAPYFTRPIFEVAGSLPALDDDAEAWIIRPREVTTDELDALAAVFGVEGEYVETTEGAGESWEYSWWQAGSSDGTGPSISVQNDSQASWWYSEGYDPSSSMISSCETSVAPTDVVAGSGSTTDSVAITDAQPCEIPPMDPPAGVPSADEAEALFAGLLEDLGFDPNDVEVETYADDWSAGVTGWLKVGGVKSSLMVSVSYGENASITFASGFLAEPEKFATYPRIGTAAALVGLQAQYDQWADETAYPTTDVVIEPAVVSEGGGTVGSEVSVSSDGSSAEVSVGGPVSPDTAPVDTGSIETVPVEPFPVVDHAVDENMVPVEPEEVIVEIVDVREELQSVYGADGEIYLIPSYVFLAEADEYGFQMPYYFYAVSDEYVQQSADIVPMMGGMSRGATGAGAVEPGVAVDPVDPVDSEVSAAQSVADGLVGLAETDATKVATGKGLEVRVVERDGEFFPATADYRTDRVNLTIVDGTVTAATIG